MSDPHGVGVNGEPDDFAARYDRFAIGGGETMWVVKVAIVLAAILGGAAVIWSLLPL
ncbi:MAG: hypothetical protein GKS06_16215 [Acidobacteria bacterium]|nr:hypothetical protein [Acidobacteriota bacterium]